MLTHSAPQDSLNLLEEQNHHEYWLEEKSGDLSIIKEKSNIQRFSIYGLFGRSDVHIPFDENIKILIGENGLGKTQVLNIFYYTLTRNWAKLSEFPFDKVELELSDEDEIITITREQCIKSFENYYKHPILKQVIKSIGVDQFEILRERMRHNSPSQIRRLINNSPVYQKLNQTFPNEYIVDFLTQEIYSSRNSRKKSDNKLTSELSKLADKIKQNLSVNTILYFPTFRRVEEDLYNLGYDEEEFFLNKEDTRLIHFGMDDVQKRFDSIENKIDLLLKEGFTKISSEILSKLVKGFGDTNRDILERINETDIDIILARVGNQIAEDEKSRIRDIVLEKKISDQDSSLVYFMQILINIYEKQKKFDNSINKFKDVCNYYLIGKQVFYDESNIKISIQSDSSDENLPLNTLSSGEKQIISIFSTIYLSEVEQKFMVLFDEPELSLSMTWQKKLLPDILNSQKCNFLLAVTHSPFIFDNQLDRYAMSLDEYIKPSKLVVS